MHKIYYTIIKFDKNRGETLINPVYFVLTHNQIIVLNLILRINKSLL
jgi:hypothetical protein